MNYLPAVLLLFSLIAIIKGEPSLRIFKNDDWLLVDGTIKESAGTNLTLSCKLVDDDNYEDQDYDDKDSFMLHHDDKLSWGRKEQNEKFENVHDLEKLTKDTFALEHLLDRSYHNEVKLYFFPLHLLDRGIYFCMSRKYNLFKTVRLDVEIDRKDEGFDVSKPLPLVFTPHHCNENAFICKHVPKCIKQDYVCDGIRDCEDGSDENSSLCGEDPCEGKLRCSNHRCISKKTCCNKFIDPECTVDVKPLCCYENNFPIHHEFEWAQPGPPFFIPTNPKTHFYDIPAKSDFDPPHSTESDFDDDNSNFHIHKLWNEGHSYKNARVVFIVVPCIVIIIIIVIIAFILQGLRNSRRNNLSRLRGTVNPPPLIPSANNAEVASTSIVISSPTPSNSNSGCGLSISSHNTNVNVSESNSCNLDLPPSYDEAMADTRPKPSAPPLDH